MVSGGIALFSSKSQSSGSDVDENPPWHTYVGVALVLVNLFLDGYTNNEQDEIFQKDKIGSLEMMQNTNTWQVVWISTYLVVGWFIQGGDSELSGAITAFTSCPDIRYDMFLFLRELTCSPL